MKVYPPGGWGGGGYFLRDCAIIIRRGGLKPEGGEALHKIAAKIGGLKLKSLI